MYARIWYEPDGVKVTTFAPGSADGDKVAACKTLLADGRVHKDATFEDVESAEELKTLLPGDRAARHKWRKNPLGRGCVVDQRVADPLHPKQKLLDAIQTAGTMEEMRALLVKVVRGDTE